MRLRDELDSCIDHGSLSLTDCPLRNPMDRLGEEGLAGGTDSGAAVAETPPSPLAYGAIAPSAFAACSSPPRMASATRGEKSLGSAA